MFTRRRLLRGASLLALTAVVPLPCAAAYNAKQEEALDLIETKICESFQFILKDGQAHTTFLGQDAYVWKSEPDLRARIKRTLDEAYKSPEMRLAKEFHGSIVAIDGRMHVSSQFALVGRFPIVPDRCDYALFDAFTAFAPPHLL